MTAVTPILQFGTSRFLQAHADLFISEAMATGDALGPITVVQSSGDQSRRSRLAALCAPDGYPVRIEGIENGEPIKRDVRVTSVARALDTASDWQQIERIAAQESEVIISNTSDAGWKEQSVDGDAGFRQEMSFPAKLTQLLKRRQMAGRSGLSILPTELVSRNGDQLRIRVLNLAEGLGGGLAEWIDREVIFANSLVDRIVSEPLEPAGAVAEPYALWTVEAKAGLTLPCNHPSIQVVESLDRIERLKLHILNLGHTYLVSRWIDAGQHGQPLVKDRLADTAIRSDLQSLYEQEVIPTFAAAGYGDEARDYANTTMDRFSNPYLAHKLSDIAQNHAEKTQRRIAAFLDWGRELGRREPQPRLVRATEVLA